MSSPLRNEDSGTRVGAPGMVPTPGNGVSTRPAQPLKPVLRTMRELRVTKGMSLRDLADLSGVAKSSLSQIERGRVWPTPHEILRIGSVLGVRLEVRIQLVHEDTPA